MNKRASIWVARGIAMATFLVLFYVSFCHDFLPQKEAYINSDLLMYPHVAMNLIHQHGHYFDWIFTNLVFLFPDLLLCLVITLFTKNIMLILMIYAFIQLGYFVWIGQALINRAAVNSQVKGAAVVMMLLALWTLAYSQNVVLSNLLHPSIHAGCTVMFLTLLFLLLVIVETQQKRFIWLFSLLFILSSVSDLLLLEQFAIPVLGSLTLAFLCRQLTWRAYWRVMLGLVALGLFSWELARLGPFAIMHLHVRMHPFHLDTLYQLLSLLRVWIHHSPFMGNLWLAFVILTPLSLLRKRGNNATDFVLLTLFLQIVVGLTFFYFFRPGTNDKVMPIRYLQPLLVIPALIGPLLLGVKHRPTWQLPNSGRSYIVIVLLMLLSVLAIPRSAINFHEILHYYPKTDACIDRHANALGLKAGLAGYWQARPLTLFSQVGLVEASVQRNLKPLLWNTSLADYREKDFNFIIIGGRYKGEGILQDAAYKQLGLPDKVLVCGHYHIAVYQHDQINRFMATNKPGHIHYTGLFRLLRRWSS